MALASLSLSSSLVNRMHLYVLHIDWFVLLLLNCGQKFPLAAIGELTRRDSSAIRKKRADGHGPLGSCTGMRTAHHAAGPGGGSELDLQYININPCVSCVAGKYSESDNEGNDKSKRCLEIIFWSRW